MHEAAYNTYLSLATLAYITLFTAHLWVRTAIKKLMRDVLEACIILSYAVLSIACGLAVGVQLFS